MSRFKLTFGASLVICVVLAGLLAPWLPLASPTQTHLDSELNSPSPQHLLGQDEEGRDVMARALYGARLSLGVACATVMISMSLGVAVGLSAAYFGGKLDELFVFVSDIFLSFPSILLIIAIAAFVPPSLWNVVGVLSLVGWVSYARLVRGQVLALRNLDYVQAARSLGFSHLRILSRHLLPNVLGPVIVNASLSVAGVIIAESTLSFLGIGVPAGTPSWGSMLDAGVAYLLIAPHLSLVPGAAIMATVLGFNFLGDGLRDRYAVKE